MSPGRSGRDPASRSTGDQAASNEERLRDLLDRLRLLPDGDRDRGQADRSAAEATAERVEHPPVEPVEAKLVDVEQVEGIPRLRPRDRPGCAASLPSASMCSGPCTSA